jgi:septal ring factor EnvC (AmiA/AmiB activator)
MTEQQQAILDAIIDSGITPEALAALLTRAAMLTEVESKRAELVRKRAERDAALAVFEADIQGLQVELAALEAQAATIL